MTRPKLLLDPEGSVLQRQMTVTVKGGEGTIQTAHDEKRRHSSPSGKEVQKTHPEDEVQRDMSTPQRMESSSGGDRRKVKPGVVSG